MFTEKEPLIARGEPGVLPRQSIPKSSHAYQSRQGIRVCLAIALATVVTLVVSLMITCMFYDYPAAVWASIVWCLMLSLIVHDFYGVGRRQPKIVAWVVVVSSFVGVGIGFAGYFRSAIFYHAAVSMATYTDVAASQPAGIFRDASMIYFNDLGHVQHERGAGYKEVGVGGDIHCVAPIYSESQPSDKITFWAVGSNCCAQGDHHRQFQCNDAADHEAHGGVVVLPREFLIPPAFFWLLPDESGVEQHLQAMQLQNSFFGDVPTEYPIFVRWLRDPQRFVDAYWWSAVHFSVGATLLYGAIIGMAAFQFVK